MDVERASDQLDVLIERRAQERSKANELAELWRASERRHQEKVRRANAALWYSHFSALADSLRASAEEFERRAQELLVDEREETR